MIFLPVLFPRRAFVLKSNQLILYVNSLVTKVLDDMIVLENFLSSILPFAKFKPPNTSLAALFACFRFLFVCLFGFRIQRPSYL